jgi:hypothetical protein
VDPYKCVAGASVGTVTLRPRQLKDRDRLSHNLEGLLNIVLSSFSVKPLSEKFGSALIYLGLNGSKGSTFLKNILYLSV